MAFVGELGEAALDQRYEAADVFVLPTRHEGYGMAVAEAVARGLPVISTPTGAIPELVDSGSGILVAIAAKHRLPVYFIGVGEQVDDLEPFSARDFAQAIAGIA